ncbi:MAG: S-layer homology domain-containing protein [Clostridia bacterium]|nr:S-layer homology domain-containing protein [Clostridia bacterium]
MKKVLCTLLSCLLLFGCFSAFAADNTDMQMQKALAFVKSKVNVPQELDKFSYQKDDSDAYGGKTAWTFRWTNEDRDASISAESVEDEQIIYYQHMTHTNRDNAALAKITKEQGEKNARAFLDSIMPASIAQAMQLKDSGSSGSEWNYQFVQMQNSYIVSDHVARLNVNKETGAVTWFSGFYENGSAYPDDDEKNIISAEEARKIFAENIGLKLVYRSNYDYRKNTLNVFPAYVLNTQSNMVMADGTIKKMEALYRNSTATANVMESGGGSGNDLARKEAFTPQELEQLQNAQNLITKEAALQKVTAAFSDAKDAVLKSASLGQDTITKGQYVWNLSMEKDNQYFHASVIANNGEIISYNHYSDTKNTSLQSEETAKKTLDTLLKSVCGSKLAACKLQEMPKEIMPLEKNSISEADDTYYSVNYVRQVNGIPFESNTISATYNRQSGKVESFRCNWYPDAQFPDISKATPETDMLTQLFDSLEYQRIYRDINGIKYLGYDFPEFTSALFDPFSGKRIGYDGQPYTDNEKPYYTDIDGHWCGDMALSLLENDVYFEGGKLNAEANVSQADFLRLLYRSEQLYADTDNDIFYKDVVRRGILSKEEVNPAGTVSRAQAARYIICMMGLDKAAELTGIYTYPFSDSIAPSDLGYVTLCYGFGIIKGDELGHFNPETAVTRAAAISMVYYKMTV